MASSIEIDVSANIAKFKAGMDKAAAEGKALNRKLDRAFKGIKNAMRGIGALAGVAVAGGLSSMVKSSINAADKIGKLSTRLGASTEALSEYRHVAELSGVSFETLTMGWQRMTRRVAEAAQGTGEAKNALKELGISAVELNQLAPERQFEVLADAISKVKNPADQVRLSMKLFDSEGVSLIQTMKGGAAGLQEMRKEAVTLGKSLSADAVKGAEDANDAITRLTASISGATTQSILLYTDEIKAAADATRVILPKAIGILIDAFKGLKVAVLSVVSGILNRLELFFKTLEKTPFIGQKFSDAARLFSNSSHLIDTELEKTIESFGKWMESGKDAGDSVKTSVIPPVKTLTTKSTELLAALKKIKDLEMAAAFDRIGDGFRDADERVKKINESLQDSYDYVDSLKDKTGEATTFMSEAWQNLERGVQNSFFNALRSGENFFKALKNLAFDILAQIAAKIATTFVFDKLLGGGSGTLLGSIGKLLGGGSGGGGGGIGSAISTALTGTKIGSALGIGGGASTALTIGDKLIFATGKIVAGAKAAGTAILGAGKTIAAALGPVGLAIAGAAVLYKIFGKRRTPQEIAEDQLRNLDISTKAGRNEQVRLGFAGDTAVSFLGGENERTVFFGIDQGKEELSALGKLLKEHYDFRGSLAVKDGILRLDLNKDFSQSHEEVVAKVKAGIIDIQLGFTQAERGVLASFGSAISKMDEFFDASAESGLSASERVVQAYTQATGQTEEQFNKLLEVGGITANRIAEVFSAASNEVLSELVGVNAGLQSSFGAMESGALGSFSVITGGLADVSRAALRAAGDVSSVGGVSANNGSTTTQQAPAQPAAENQDEETPLVKQVTRIANNLDVNTALLSPVATG